MHVLLHYTRGLITQMAQTAVCTQELIANMLGVPRRGHGGEAAGKLQKLGVIEYREQRESGAEKSRALRRR